MKIVDRKTFLTLPAGTLFAKFSPQPKNKSHLNLSHDDAPSIKGRTVGKDFYVQDLFPFFEDANNDSEHIDVLVSMLEGKNSPPADYNVEMRDGLFDADQLFAVWSIDDARALIAVLQDAVIEQKYGRAPVINYEKALEVWNDRSNGADEGRSTGKGGRAWLSGEFQLCELEALCLVLRHEAGDRAEGLVELLAIQENML